MCRASGRGERSFASLRMTVRTRRAPKAEAARAASVRSPSSAEGRTVRTDTVSKRTVRAERLAMPVITITGLVGSGTAEIGAEVARSLGIDYVDRMILAEAAKKIGTTVAAVAERTERT